MNMFVRRRNFYHHNTTRKKDSYIGVKITFSFFLSIYCVVFLGRTDLSLNMVFKRFY